MTERAWPNVDRRAEPREGPGCACAPSNSGNVSARPTALPRRRTSRRVYSRFSCITRLQPCMSFPELNRKARNMLKIAAIARDQRHHVCDTDRRNPQVMRGTAQLLLAPFLILDFRLWSKR